MSVFDLQLSRFPVIAVSDYRKMAIKRLPRQLVDFLDGGAFDEVTIRKNRTFSKYN